MIYYLIMMLYRQTDDFLILNDDPIRIPTIISVFIKLFYTGTAIRSFSDSQNCKENLPVSHLSPVNCFYIITRLSTTQSKFQEAVKQLNKGHKKGN